MKRVFLEHLAITHAAEPQRRASLRRIESADDFHAQGPSAPQHAHKYANSQEEYMEEEVQRKRSEIQEICDQSP